MADTQACYECSLSLTQTIRVCPRCNAQLLLYRGTRFYRITGFIARGGFGRVFDAVEGPHLNRRVAIKQIEESLPVLTSQIIKNEVDLLSSHGSSLGFIPDIYEYWRAGRQHYIVMQYIEGETLDKLYAGRTWPVARAMECLGALLQQLDTLHRAGIIHRDIKPNNIKYGVRRQYILLDFGLASRAGGTVLRARTPAYAPPEQLDDRPAHLRTDQRSDLYSLAATIYYLLTGQPPQPPLRNGSGARAPLDFPQSVPTALRDLLTRMLAANPNDRPPSAYACLQLFRAIDIPADDSSVASGDPDAPTALGAGEQREKHTTKKLPEAPPTYLPSTYKSSQPARLYGRNRDIAISPDGVELAVATSLGLVRYHLTDGQEQGFAPHNAPIRRARYTGHDRSLLIVDPQRIHILDAHGRSSHHSIRWVTKGDERTVIVAARGNRLIEVSEQAVVLQALDAPGYAKHFPGANVAALTPEGDWLALGAVSEVSIYSLGEDAAPLILTSASGPVIDLEFSDDGQLLAVATRSGVTIWRLPGRQQVFATSGALGQISDIALSPDGARLAIAADSGVWLYLTARPGAAIGPAESADSGVLRVVFSPDGQTLAGCAPGGVWVWEADTSRLRYSHSDPYLDAVQCLAVSPNGKLLASLGGSLRLWEIGESGTITLRHTLGRFVRAANSLAFDPTGQYLAAATAEGVWLCNLAGKTIHVEQVLATGSIAQSHAVMFADNGASLLTFGADGVIRHSVRRFFLTDHLDDSAQPQDCIEPGIVGSDAYGVAFARGGSLLAAYNRTTVEILRDDGSRVCVIETSYINDVALSADQQLLAVTTQDRAELWRIGPEPQRIDTVPGGSMLVTFSPDSQQLALIQLMDDTIPNRQTAMMVYHLVSSQFGEAFLLSMHNEEASDVAFLPGRQALFSAGKDGAIQMWRYDPGPQA